MALQNMSVSAGSGALHLVRYSVAFLLAFLCSVVFTAIILKVSKARGWTVTPRPDRWHHGMPAKYGGVAIWLSFIGVAVLLVPFANALLWKLIGVSTALFLVGLYDDIYSLAPRRKLLLQMLAASLVFAVGVTYPFRESILVNLVVSGLWVIGIINAFNLIDNMDGLSAGVGVISAIYVGLLFFLRGASENALVAFILAGVLGGFLLFNRSPAKIFMGDAGSLFLGGLLATISMLDVTHLSGLSSFLLVPIVLMTVPIFETFFVSVTRRMRGQAISQGGTDHSSHRLVRLGLSERKAVLLLCAISAGSGAIAVGLHYLTPEYSLGLVSLWMLFVALFGIHLFRSEEELTSGADTVRRGALSRILHRDSLAILVDPVILSISYFLAFFFRFTGSVSPADQHAFFQTWPLVLGIKFVCLWGSGIYQMSWWRMCRKDAYRLLQSLVLGEMFCVVAMVGIYRFSGLSRTVFLLDAMISGVLFILARRSFSTFRDIVESLNPPVANVRRAFILGTSQRVELVLSYLRDRKISCVGLIDINHGGELGRRIWGTPVLGHVNDLLPLVERHAVCDLILSEEVTDPQFVEQLDLLCRQHGLELLRLGLYQEERTNEEPTQSKEPRLRGKAASVGRS